jgi:F0F1-type ATP synthase assembly protein I
MVNSRYVDTDRQIPRDDYEEIRKRLINKIAAMDDAGLKILNQSDDSFKKYVTEAFRSIAKLLGYTVGSVIGIFIDIGEGFIDGFMKGIGK